MKTDTLNLLPVAVVAITAALMLTAAVPDGHAQDIKPLTEAEVVAQGGVRLTGAQIVATNVGNTLIALKVAAGPKFPKGMTVTLFYRDAKTRISRDGTRVIESLWWIEGDQSCAENKVERIGHVCGNVYRLGNGFYYCERNTPVCEWYIRVVPGNPENIK